MKRFQPLFQLLNLLVLHGTSRVGGANGGRFGVGNPNRNPQDRQRYLTNGVTGNLGSRLQSTGLLAIGLVQVLILGNGARLLDQVAQMVNTADVADAAGAAGAAYLRDCLEAGLSSIALRLSDLPSIEISKPRLNSGGSRRLYVVST